MANLFNDVVINKLSGGLGRRSPDQDMVSGLLFDGKEIYKKTVGTGAGAEVSFVIGVPADLASPPAETTYSKSLEYGKPLRLASLDDAEANGLTKEYDVDTAGQSAYFQVAQYFRMNPSGDVYVMVVNPTDNASYAAVVSNIKDMQEQAAGNMRQVAALFSGDVTKYYTDEDGNYTEADGQTQLPNQADQTTWVVEDAMAGTKDAIVAAQTQASECFADYMPLEVLIEGKKFDVDATVESIQAQGENVSVVVAMDVESATQVTKIEVENGADLTADYSDSAAVGMVLGTVSRAKVSENIAWVEKFNMTGEGFQKATFVGGKSVTSLGTLKTFDEAKLIFARKHTGLNGLYLNDSHTGAEKNSDFSYIENNRTIHKATRIVREALLPKLNSPVLVNPEDGKLPPTVVKGFETLCRRALEGMISNEEVSGFDVYVDPSQNILSTSTLRVRLTVVPMGTARRIEVNLGFENPFGVDQA